MISVNGRQIKPTIFPDKTSQVWHINNIEALVQSGIAIVDWNFEDEAEIMHLAQLKMLLDKYGAKYTKLCIHYLPYGRQDKQIDNDATFALHAFAIMINSMNFSEVLIIDPHSDVALKLINNSSATYPIHMIENICDDFEIGGLCYPDKGADSKYYGMLEHLAIPSLVGEKVRDQATGNITHYALSGNPHNMNILIVDDICDGGATFIILAKKLYEMGAQSVHLFVTHGLFTKGTNILADDGNIRSVHDKDGLVYKIVGNCSK